MKTSQPCSPRWFRTLQCYAKFIAAVLGAVITSGAQFLPTQVNQIITITSAIATAIAVFAVENQALPDQSLSLQKLSAK